MFTTKEFVVIANLEAFFFLYFFTMLTNCLHFYTQAKSLNLALLANNLGTFITSTKSTNIKKFGQLSLLFVSPISSSSTVLPFWPQNDHLLVTFFFSCDTHLLILSTKYFRNLLLLVVSSFSNFYHFYLLV